MLVYNLSANAKCDLIISECANERNLSFITVNSTVLHPAFYFYCQLHWKMDFELDNIGDFDVQWCPLVKCDHYNMFSL